jgi:hypothetical protein
MADETLHGMKVAILVNREMIKLFAAARGHRQAA